MVTKNLYLKNSPTCHISSKIIYAEFDMTGILINYKLMKGTNNCVLSFTESNRTLHFVGPSFGFMKLDTCSARLVLKALVESQRYQGLLLSQTANTLSGDSVC